jgi:hypothetical protein
MYRSRGRALPTEVTATMASRKLESRGLVSMSQGLADWSTAKAECNAAGTMGPWGAVGFGSIAGGG